MKISIFKRRWKNILTGLVMGALLLLAIGALIGCTISSPISDETAAKIAQSPHQKEGVFVNFEPKAEFEFDTSVMMETLFNSAQRKPKGAVPIVKIAAARWQKPPSDRLQVAWLGHASTLIEMDRKRILIDPMLSERASPFTFAGPKRFHPAPIDLETLSNVDGVIISHNHYDHLDRATIQHLAQSECQFFIPLGLRDQLRSWGVKDTAIHELDWWQTAPLGGLDIVMTPARHYSNRGLQDYQKTLWGSWAILGSQKIFFSGDSGYSKEFTKIGHRFGPFDLSMIKVGAYGPGQSWADIHMTPEEAVQVHQDIKGQVMLPVHWATFDLALHSWDAPVMRSVLAAQKAGIRLITPRIGEVFTPTHQSRTPHWWAELAPKEVP